MVIENSDCGAPVPVLHFSDAGKHFGLENLVQLLISLKRRVWGIRRATISVQVLFLLCLCFFFNLFNHRIRALLIKLEFNVYV